MAGVFQVLQKTNQSIFPDFEFPFVEEQAPFGLWVVALKNPATLENSLSPI
jgi:hypothetical protein